MSEILENQSGISIERPRMDVDIVCVGFGPAMGGFLATLARHLKNPDGSPRYESQSTPGMPLQVLCYERADDVAFGVSGIVSRARSIKNTLPPDILKSIPMACEVKEEKLVYMLDPHGASRRSYLIKAMDKLIRALKFALPFKDDAVELPWIPEFLHKKDGWIFSMGQFMQWVATEIQSGGDVQIWPGTPAAEAIIEGNYVKGIRLIDQGVDKNGKPTDGFVPGMEVRANLTVIGDGPVGVISRQIDEVFGVPENYSRHEWALGMKFVVDLPENSVLKPGTVFHTIGYPEPEIFGFMYVHPGNIASFGIFVPSWFYNPIRTAYRYLQHWMLHPYFWKYLKDSKIRSWGAKSILESGRRGTPYLVGNGYAKIGECSGTTNVLTNSGVDEAWESGVILAESVLEMLDKKLPFTKENLEKTYVKRRRESWLEKESRIAEKARDGFNCGFISGLIGMALSGLTNGKINLPCRPISHKDRMPTIEEFYKDKISAEELARIKKECIAKGVAINTALMEKAGWQPIPYDGKLLISHQDALLIGGKVQAPQGYADHVRFIDSQICVKCERKVCIEMCSGQAITPGENGIPVFDREKCVHCGACLWNCLEVSDKVLWKTNVEFLAGTGGFHSSEN